MNGSGSTYVAIAMDEWQSNAQIRGFPVNYTAIGSPAGVSQYKGGQVDYAGTEAEVKSLQNGDPNVARGFQYIPDVAGRKVDYLHLDQRTIGGIFTGDITNWNDPAITATNGGKAFPSQPIKVVFRSGRSGTTALFYDFVKNAVPDAYDRFRAKFSLSDGRIVELDNASFPGGKVPLGDSDSIAQYIASPNGEGAIGYDEFGYAKKHNTSAAWVRNGAGQWVLPYAENISVALNSATLRPDLSQELSHVYTSRDAKAYPISAYSYLMTQCANGPATCRGNYSDHGKVDTLSKFIRYVACDGQQKMAIEGYSPLPPNLSQEMVNSISRMTGSGTPETLTPANCNNPRFHGSLGPGASSPSDPFKNLPGGVAAATNSGRNGSTATAAPKASTAGVLPNSTSSAHADDAATARNIQPVGFNGPGVPPLGMLPVLVLLSRARR